MAFSRHFSNKLRCVRCVQRWLTAVQTRSSADIRAQWTCVHLTFALTHALRRARVTVCFISDDEGECLKLLGPGMPEVAGGK